MIICRNILEFIKVGIVEMVRLFRNRDHFFYIESTTAAGKIAYYNIKVPLCLFLNVSSLRVFHKFSTGSPPLLGTIQVPHYAIKIWWLSNALDSLDQKKDQKCTKKMAIFSLGSGNCY